MWPSGIVPREGAIELFVSKEDFKFNAAHFVIHERRRERIHGHNYRVSLTVNGSVGTDGYVLDFGDVKKVMRGICHELDEHFLLPDKSPFLTVLETAGQIDITTNAGDRFSLPGGDVMRLPLCNISVEELAQYICRCFVMRVTAAELQRHRIVQITVGVGETSNQEARFTVDVRGRGADLNVGGTTLEGADNSTNCVALVDTKPGC